jgi:hypothetical protein
MTYIINNLTNNNLFTNGEEFADSSGKLYSGPYHQLFNGQIYSGDSPLSPTKQLLNRVPIDEPQSKIQNTPTNLEYSNLNPQNQELFEYGKNPIAHFPQPQNKDYKRGQIERYFAKKRNSSPTLILEINQSTYNDLFTQSGEYNYALWQVVKIFWKITGPLRDTRNPNGVISAGIVDTNERLVNFTNQTFRGIKGYLSNLIQLAVKPNLELISNQYTSGSEFIVRLDGSSYVGNYHIMANGVIMDGATHTQSQNKTLLPTSVIVQGQVNTLINEALGNIGSIPTQSIRQQQQPQESVDPPPQISTFTPPEVVVIK